MRPRMTPWRRNRSGKRHFTTKVTKDTKGSENLNSALRPKAFGRQAGLRALRVLRGEKVFRQLHRMRVTTDAVPVGHRILHRIFKGGTEFAEFGEFFNRKLFTPRPPRLGGEFSFLAILKFQVQPVR